MAVAALANPKSQLRNVLAGVEYVKVARDLLTDAEGRCATGIKYEVKYSCLILRLSQRAIGAGG